MRNLGRFMIATSIALALTACGKKAEAPVTEASEVAAATDAAVAALPTPGAYEVMDTTGKVVAISTINADGSYADQAPGAARVAGIVKLVDGKTCFDPSGTAPAECYTVAAPGADGSFTATDAKGVVMTIRPKAK